MAQEQRVAHHDEQSLGPGHSHVEPLKGRSGRVTGGKGLKEGSIPSTRQVSNLGVLKETQVEIQIQLHKALAAPHGGDENDAALLALELFYGAHLEGETQGLQGSGSRHTPCLMELPIQRAPRQGRCRHRAFVTGEGVSILIGENGRMPWKLKGGSS